MPETPCQWGRWGPKREGKGVCVCGGGGGVIAWWERAVSGKGLPQNQDSCSHGVLYFIFYNVCVCGEGREVISDFLHERSICYSAEVSLASS